MRYYFIRYWYELEVEINVWRSYENTVLVEAISYEEAISKIKSSQS
jgi:hypothetical protein